jgi:hypothetical protein
MDGGVTADEGEASRIGLAAYTSAFRISLTNVPRYR